MNAQFAKILILIGVVLSVTGLVLLLGPKVPFIGRLPGDIIVKKENFSLYVPLTTSVIISLVLSLILWLFKK